MDSRAKQRLTGAVILVALFVLLVPELLTGPKSGGTSDAPAEEGMRRYTIDLDAPAGAAQPSPSPGPEQPVALPPVAENPMSGAAQRALPGESAQAETNVPAPVVAPMAAPPRETVATNPVTASPAAKPAVPSAAPASSGAFAVQLGSFNVKDNADRLVRDMTAKGFNAFVAPITSGGRELYRVRVGPTRDRASAEALAAQLRRVGQTGSIVPIS